MSEFFIHNTLSRQKEVFTPIDPAHVRMYVCGPTVYDLAHVGNARPAVVFDTVYRLLRRRYPKVTYARNITDVDDKIMAKALSSGESIETITTRTTQFYHEDMAALNALPPDLEPRCTQHIPQMVAMIKSLIDKGHAYAVDGHVLFNVPSMKNYGELSRRPAEELIAGARVEVAPYKKDAMDFVLWKPSDAQQVGWDSPWGKGRPGWHIECSAMAKEHLGITFDIHGGGLDLIFPHHENEIAQSRCAHDGAPLANYWMHNGFLTMNNDKMSKSIGNIFTVRDLLNVVPGEAIRLALLSGHYRQPLDFSHDALLQAKLTLDKWYGALRDLKPVDVDPASISEKVETALLDDLNTPLAISHLHEIVTSLNKASDTSEKLGIARRLVSSANSLGLLQQNPALWFRWTPSGADSSGDAAIDEKIAARLRARQTKDFAEADRLRDELLAQGVVLEDKAGATTWRRT